MILFPRFADVIITVLLRFYHDFITDSLCFTLKYVRGWVLQLTRN